MIHLDVGKQFWVVGVLDHMSVLATVYEWYEPNFGHPWVRVLNEELHFNRLVWCHNLREFSGWPVRPQTGVERMPGPHA